MTTFKTDDILVSKCAAVNGVMVVNFYRIVSINGRKLTLALLTRNDEYTSERSGLTTPRENVTGTITVNWSGYPGVKLNAIEVAHLWDGKPVPFYV